MQEKVLKENINNKKTVVINAFGGPGAGKTTACYDIVSTMKKKGYVADYVPEYATELVWDEKYDMLNGTEENQKKIFEVQKHRIDRLIGKVDFVVTDSPLILNVIYNKELTPEYEDMVLNAFNEYTNFNFFVERDDSKFTEIGRIHNLEESKKKDREIKDMLKKNNIYYGTYTHDTINKIIDNSIKLHKSINDTNKKYVPKLGTKPKESSLEQKAYYDIDQIKAIPIERVAETFGIQLKKKGNSLWGKIRDEKEESFKIYPETNTWYDFGLGKGGSNIQLVSEIKNVNYDEAIQLLGNIFNIPTKNHIRKDWIPPTNQQYKKIGIQGDRATKNFDFNENLSIEQKGKISEKYNMTMGELAKKYPNVYHSIIRKVAVPYVYNQKQYYYKCLGDYVNILKNEPTEFNKLYYGGRARDAYNELKESYEILKKAIIGQAIKVYKLNADFDKDVEKMREGKISYEIGNVPYAETKKNPGIHYIKVSENEFAELQKLEIPYSAFKKGDDITVVVNDDFFRQFLSTIGRSYKIGNTQYKDLIRQEVYCCELNKELGEHITKVIAKQNIPYSAVVKPENIKIAVPKQYENNIKTYIQEREQQKHEQIEKKKMVKI